MQDFTERFVPYSEGNLEINAFVYANICVNKSNPTKNVKNQKKTSEDVSYTTSEVFTFY